MRSQRRKQQRAALERMRKDRNDDEEDDGLDFEVEETSLFEDRAVVDDSSGGMINGANDLDDFVANDGDRAGYGRECDDDVVTDIKAQRRELKRREQEQKRIKAQQRAVERKKKQQAEALARRRAFQTRSDAPSVKRVSSKSAATTDDLMASLLNFSSASESKPKYKRRKKKTSRATSHEVAAETDSVDSAKQKVEDKERVRFVEDGEERMREAQQQLEAEKDATELTFGRSSDTASPQVEETTLVDDNSMDDDAVESSDDEEEQEFVADENATRFFWLDAYEDPASRRGIIWLFGKVLAPGATEVQNAVVQVHGLNRQMYFLPRDGFSTADVRAEVDMLRRQWGATKFGTKTVKLRYSFAEHSVEEGDNGVPEVATYLMAQLPFTARVPRGPTGRSFRRCFGSRASATESLVLQRDLRGPCWLQLRAPCPPKKRTCPSEVVEMQVEARDIHRIPLNEAPEAPTLSVVSISMQTLKGEVVLAALTAMDDVRADAPTNPKGASLIRDSLVLARKLSHPKTKASLPFPKGFFGRLKEQLKGGKAGAVKCVDTEAQLLQALVDAIASRDPDVLIAHDLHESVMRRLFARLSACARGTSLAQKWSRIGRLNRAKFPQGADRPGRQFSRLQWIAGRLLLDTEVLVSSPPVSNAHVAVGCLQVSSRELLPSKREYSLDFLATDQKVLEYLHLPKSQEKQLRDFNRHIATINDGKLIRAYHENKGEMLAFLCGIVRSSAVSSLGLALRLQILPLTKQLTSLCGNVWQRSLASQRAERNEFLLLHALKSDWAKELAKTNDDSVQGFLPPEKYNMKERTERLRKLGKVMDDKEAKGQRRRRAQYKGGFVLEPERGHYDRVTVLLDFNSLYPSVIREFNIDFTTVAHWAHNHSEEGDDSDALPEKPKTGQAEGILPRVLAKLLRERAAVKDAMKKEKDETRKGIQNVRQLALKLVCNSMYGTLGFPASRFCCKPLAALITAEGREAIQTAKRVAEELDLTDVVKRYQSSSAGSVSSGRCRVIYGDTDSIMVHMDTHSVPLALAMARRIQQQINRQYSKMYLDVDYIFRRLLLYAKKRYAGLKVNEKGEFEALDMKGLDIVRRDWCGLTKRLGMRLLNEVFACDPSKKTLKEEPDLESAVTCIHAMLTKAREELEKREVPPSLLAVRRGINKRPDEYTDAHRQPHVQVAMRLIKQGDSVKRGDPIPYIICKEYAHEVYKTQAPKKLDENNVALRAFHPKEVLAKSLTVDIDYYAEHQILPPIARLLHPLMQPPLQYTSMAQVAECLKIAEDKYAQMDANMSSGQAGAQETTNSVFMEAAFDDMALRQSTAPFMVTLPQSKKTMRFPEIYVMSGDGFETKYEIGLDKCPEIAALPVTSLRLQLRKTVRELLQRFMRGETRCGRCNVIFRMSSMTGSCERCGGALERPGLSDMDLRMQLEAWVSLFDRRSNTQQIMRANSERQQRGHSVLDVPKLSPQQENLLDALRTEVQQFLDTSYANHINRGVFARYLGF
ncbi:MAG: hypothetical protein MHM6MM_000285 [Cercozoa sp. M6MM]